MSNTGGAGAVYDEIAGSIEATLHREWRVNEQIIARVRAALLGALCVLELITAAGPGGVSFVDRLPTFGFLVLSLVLLAILHRRFYHWLMPILIPFFDGAFITIRLQTVFSHHHIDTLQQEMELTTVFAAAALLILAGAYRLRREGLLASIVLGLALFYWFAMQTQLTVTQLTIHSVLLLAIGGMAWGLTWQVHRAVRSEVARLTFARFLPTQVMDEAHDNPLALLTRPRSVEATVLVSDIRGFTSWAENRSPIDVLDFLNVIQGALAEIVRKNHGTVDKFMGDGMLAVFGALDALQDHAAKSLNAAQQMLTAVAEINARSSDADVRVGIGIHSGELVVGCLGSGLRLEFTVLGDTVNTCSRLESLTKTQGVDVLVSGQTAALLESLDGLREVGQVTIRGRKEPLTIFTLL